MTHSEQIDRLADALAKAQGEIQNVVKDAKNPHYKSEYATLDAVTDTVRPVFAKHGLSVVQVPAYADGIVTVETMLLHSSGQWILGLPAAPLAKMDAQGVGSATTYLRRYSLAGLAAIAQTDDDGNRAGRQPEPSNELPELWRPLASDVNPDKGYPPLVKPLPQPPSSPPPPAQRSVRTGHGADLLISEKQAARFHAIAKGAGWRLDALKGWLWEVWQFKDSADITRAKYDEICTQVQRGPDA